MPRKSNVYPMIHETLKNSAGYFFNKDDDGWIPGEHIRQIGRQMCFPSSYGEDGKNSEDREMAKLIDGVREIARRKGERFEFNRNFRNPAYRFRSAQEVTLRSIEKRDENIGKLIDYELLELGYDIEDGIALGNAEMITMMREIYEAKLYAARQEIHMVIERWHAAQKTKRKTRRKRA
jgi:hypothetical protein